MRCCLNLVAFDEVRKKAMRPSMTAGWANVKTNPTHKARAHPDRLRLCFRRPLKAISAGTAADAARW